MTLKNKSILLTGGTGSFGQAFTKIVLSKHNPKEIRIYSRDEDLQGQMRAKFNDDRLDFILGDVRDKQRLHRAMTGVDLVVHAAAIKVIPYAEANPTECIRTNIGGAMNIVECAIENNIEKVLGISSDKACHPVNLYGATKMAMEKLFVQANTYMETKFSCLRYGNVINSRGSVIPKFLEQKKKGELTITNPNMTRFLITLEEGISFAIKCIQKMKGGEIFIPKGLKSVKIIDLARIIAPDIAIKNIGIRPGEKIHEILISEDEVRHTLILDFAYVIEPELRELDWWDGKYLGFMPDYITYSSKNNLMPTDELEELVRKWT